MTINYNHMKKKNVLHLLTVIMVAMLGIGFAACSGSDDVEVDNKGNVIHYGNGMDGSTLNVKLSSAGTLASYINDSTMYKVSRLKVTGELNSTDFWLLRQMAGSDEDGRSTRGVLGYLDLSEATVVAGGRPFYRSYTTTNDVLSTYAFRYCNSLTSVSLPRVKEVEEWAFEECDGITSLTIPETVEDMCRAFSRVSGLTDVTCYAHKIGVDAFEECRNLSKVTLQNTDTIDGWAFAGCYSLQEITIPSSVKAIGESAFSFCGLTKVSVPNSVKDLSLVFKGCTKLTSVELPMSVTTLYGTFINCKSLQSISIPSSVSNISAAFWECKNLTSVEVPNSVVKMDSTFYGCI